MFMFISEFFVIINHNQVSGTYYEKFNTYFIFMNSSTATSETNNSMNTLITPAIKPTLILTDINEVQFN